MSKAQLLEIGNINMFPNSKPQVTFLLGRDKETQELDKVQASYSGWDKDKGIDLKALNMKANGTNVPYTRLAITLGEAANRSYFNGVLFKNKKKVPGSNQPDFTGTLDLTKDRNGEKLILAAWDKTGRESGAPFISVAISEPRPQGAAPAEHAAPPAQESSSVPMDDDSYPF